MNTDTPIYKITSLYLKEREDKSPGKPDHRQIDFKQFKSSDVGFYFDLEKAKKCVEEDWGSFSEAGYYNYVVISKSLEGLYNLRVHDGIDPEDSVDKKIEWWYIDDPETNKWVSCDRPAMCGGCFGF